MLAYHLFTIYFPNYNYYIRFSSNKEPIYNNTDSSKYITYEGHTLFNSATFALSYDNRSLVGGLFLFNESATIKREGGSGGSWEDQGDIYTAYSQNDIYYIGISKLTENNYNLYCNGELTNTETGQTLSILESAVPIFTSSTDYIDYTENVAPPLYQWSSVPAISGKNGILLPLSTLNDVNNGEEITTSDTSKFSLTEASNVAKLVGNIINAQG